LLKVECERLKYRIAGRLLSMVIRLIEE